MQNVAFIKTGDGNITLVIDSKTFAVGKSHRNYDKILDALRTKTYKSLEALIDVQATIAARMGGNKGSVTVRNGEVFYRGTVMHNTITERILAFVDENLPTAPLIRFLENLLENPMPAAVMELYDFLDHKGFPITEDGCFIGYKGVRNDWLDAHSGTVSNEIGKIIAMPREKVDPDRRNECSYGYHVGTLEYAKNFAARTLLVKVNPADCIAVPMDHNCSKLRVCKYEVIAEAQALIETPMWPMPQPAVEHESEEETDEYGDPVWNDVYDEVATTVKSGHNSVSRSVKRLPCSYCKAKGGKKHARTCKRPRKS